MAFEFLADNRKVAYPFEDSPEDGLHELFVDACVVYTTSPNTGRLKLVLFDPVATVKRLKLQFEDGTVLGDLSSGIDNVVFNSYSFGDYEVYEWRKLATLDEWFTGEELVARFTVYPSALNPPLTYPIASNVVLISSLVNHQASQVRKLAVKQPGLDCCNNHFADGFVRLECGSNMSLVVNKPTVALGLGLTQVVPVRARASITVEAIAGEGTGQAFGCPDAGDPVIKTVRRQQPDQYGNLALNGDGCVWVERKLATSGFTPVNPNTDYQGEVEQGRLRINGDCKACCDCADYGAAYEALTDVWNSAKLVAAKLANVKARYEAIRKKWLESAQCNQSPVMVKLALFARADYHLAVAASVVNRSGHELSGVKLDFNVDPTGTYERGSGLLTRPNEATIQIDGVSINVGHLKDGEQATFSFEERWYGTSDPLGFGLSRLGLIVNVSVKAHTSLGTFSDFGVQSLKPPLVKS